MADKVDPIKKAAMEKFPYRIKYADLKVGSVYHLPPLLTVKRMNIKLTYFDTEGYAHYYNILDENKRDKKFHHTSIMARMLTQQKKF